MSGTMQTGRHTALYTAHQMRSELELKQLPDKCFRCKNRPASRPVSRWDSRKIEHWMLTLHDRDRCISQFDHGRDATAYHHGGQQFLRFQSSSQTHYAHYAGRVHSRKRKATVGPDRQSVCLSVCLSGLFFSRQSWRSDGIHFFLSRADMFVIIGSYVGGQLVVHRNISVSIVLRANASI